MTTQPYKYAILDGDAVLLGEFDAWTYLNGQWQRMSNADAFTKAGLIDHAKFVSLFGNIENSLPDGAFA